MPDNGVPEGFRRLGKGTNCVFYSDEAEEKFWIEIDPSERPGGGSGKNPRVATSHGFKGFSVGDEEIRISLNAIV